MTPPKSPIDSPQGRPNFPSCCFPDVVTGHMDPQMLLEDIRVEVPYYGYPEDVSVTGLSSVLEHRKVAESVPDTMDGIQAV